MGKAQKLKALRKQFGVDGKKKAEQIYSATNTVRLVATDDETGERETIGFTNTRISSGVIRDYKEAKKLL